MAKIKIAGATLNQIPIHWNHNLNNIINAIKMAKSEGVKILCLPELCLTGYGCEDLFLSEWLPKKAISLISKIVPLTQGIAVTIGLPIRTNGFIYNCVVVLNDESVVGISAKQFLANDGVHYEPRWFKSWNPGKVINFYFNDKNVPFGDVTYDLHGVKVGFEICEDAWQPDRPASRLLEKEVQLILNPSASHFAFGKSYVRERLVVDSSEKFRCYYIYTNLLGNEAGRMIYDGEIVIAGHGKILKYNSKLSFEDINLISIEIEPESSYPKSNISSIPKENKFDVFVQAESLALFDYMRKSNTNGFVLSLSGGADSSSCAILIAEMVRRSIAELGMELCLEKLHLSALMEKCESLNESETRNLIVNNILHCAYQGTKNSTAKTLESAAKLALEIGAKFDHWNIDEEVQSYSGKIQKILKRPLSWEKDDIAMQNIQARARSPIIWMLANIKNSLLMVTSNRSEGDVGYATMDGDTSGSIAPIAAIDKHFIIKWLKWAEMELNYSSLSYVNNLNPTAELRPPDKKQTDEDDLMPYHVIVEIEKLAIRERLSPVEIFSILNERDITESKLLKKYIRKFYLLWSRNQWKRERTAPAFHLDDFNVDPRTWCRFPILSSGFTEELADLDII